MTDVLEHTAAGPARGPMPRPVPPELKQMWESSDWPANVGRRRLRERTIKAIMTEGECSRQTAIEMVRMFRKAAVYLRIPRLWADPYYVLTPRELEQLHPTLALIMPGGRKNPKPDSAQDLLRKIAWLPASSVIVHGETASKACMIGLTRQSLN